MSLYTEITQRLGRFILSNVHTLVDFVVKSVVRLSIFWIFVFESCHTASVPNTSETHTGGVQ